jgi:hypothetical protein
MAIGDPNFEAEGVDPTFAVEGVEPPTQLPT